MFASQQWQGDIVSGLFQLSSRAVAGCPEGPSGPAPTPPAGANAGLPAPVLPSWVIACISIYGLDCIAFLAYICLHVCDGMYGSNKCHCSETKCNTQQHSCEVAMSDKHRLSFTGHSRELASLHAANMHVR